MKKIVLATVAFSLIATPAAFAQHYPVPHHSGKHHSAPKHYSQKHHKVQKHRWAKGQRFHKGQGHHVIRERDYGRYHLRRPPHGHHWVRVDNEFILVATATGIIASILHAATH